MPKGKRTKKQQPKSNIDIQVILLIVISIILAILIYAKSGYIGENLTPFLGGIIGWVKYIIPIGTFAIAIYLISENDKDYLTKKLIQYGLLIISLSVIVTVYHESRGNLDVTKDFEEVITIAYDNGTKNIGGGLLRSPICYAAYKLDWKN